MGGIVKQEAEIRLVVILLLKLNKLIGDLLVTFDLCFASLLKGEIFHLLKDGAR